MDVTKFNFPKVDWLDDLKADKDLLKEAKARGFYNGHTVYNKLFSKLFFKGGKVKLKENLDENFKAAAWPYCRILMQSFSLGHNEKEAICALLFSELLEA